MTITTSHAPWVLREAVELDRYHSFCGAFLRMSAERQHVVAAFLSSRKSADGCGDAATAQFLLTATHREILARAYDDLPQGLRGALARSGHEVHQKPYYRTLYALLTEPQSRHTRKLIAHAGGLDMERLTIINTLPREVSSLKLMGVLTAARDAERLSVAVQTLIGRGIDRNWLSHRLRMVETRRALTSVIREAVRQLKASSHPVPSCDFYAPIETGDELLTTAKRFRNCMRNFLGTFLDNDGDDAFAIATMRNEEFVVHLTREERGWRLAGIFGVENTAPPRAVAVRIGHHLSTNGVMTSKRDRYARSPWSQVQHFLEDGLLRF